MENNIILKENFIINVSLEDFKSIISVIDNSVLDNLYLFIGGYSSEIPYYKLLINKTRFDLLEYLIFEKKINFIYYEDLMKEQEPKAILLVKKIIENSDNEILNKMLKIGIKDNNTFVISYILDKIDNIDNNLIMHIFSNKYDYYLKNIIEHKHFLNLFEKKSGNILDIIDNISFSHNKDILISNYLVYQKKLNYSDRDIIRNLLKLSYKHIDDIIKINYESLINKNKKSKNLFLMNMLYLYVFNDNFDFNKISDIALPFIKLRKILIDELKQLDVDSKSEFEIIKYRKNIVQNTNNIIKDLLSNGIIDQKSLEDLKNSRDI